MKHEVITFGCRLNTYESEVIKEAFKGLDGEDVVVFNTCAVTKEAERQARQAIRKAKRDNPNARIIVTGCSAQVNPTQYSDMVEVDKVLGNEEKFNIPFHLKNAEKVIVNDIMSVKETASHLIEGFEGRARAFVQVQNGCDHRCTFCIIPYGRGNSRSVPIGEIVNQVRTLVKSGYNEVVLTGVDITAYGKDLPSSPTLGQMVRRLLNLVPELPRLRFSSLDVAEVDADLLDLYENEKRIMPHIHISLQAGDDMVLKRMKRRHTRSDVVEFCDKLRQLRPDVVFGADIIAGFPTETDEMFDNTLNLVSEAGIQYLHVFPYSKREGTPAAKMPQVEKQVRKDRAAKLRQAGDLELQKYLKNCEGTIRTAIVEKELYAREEGFAGVKLTSPAEVGSLVAVKITGFEGQDLIGEVA